MKKGVIRVIALILAILMLAGILSSIFTAHAAQIPNEVYGYGAGLNKKEIEDTAKLLGIKDLNITQVPIKGIDTSKYLGIQSTDEEMISSVYVKKNNNKSISVEVTTPLTIQKVTSIQYSNAAITAGLENVDIKVAAVRAVTGESALAGVYKVFEQSGIAIDKQKTKVANEEIEVVNKISDEHKGQEGFSKDKLNKVVIDVKQKLLDEKKSGNDLSNDKIKNIVENSVKNGDLNQVINNVNIENLTLYFKNFINIDNLNINVVQGQLDNLLKNIPNIANKELDNVKTFLNTDEGKNFLNSIKDNLTKENLQKVADGVKNALDSEQFENALNSVKDNLDTKKLSNMIDGVKKSISNDGAGFFLKLFNGIGNFFKTLFDSLKNLF
ncbi:DUF1002 domain-containing protein [Helcococcus bovis]|uniref:DUF1002 domain-containing protein n=1 Tax=Helcococcus bovis TaxID=3153252 RepID=UPI0038BDF897